MMTDYPITVRWTGDARTKFETRQLEPLDGTPDEQLSEKREWVDLSFEVNGRQKTQLVVKNEREHEAIIKMLENFRESIGHPLWGATWASKNKDRAAKRVLQELKEAKQ